MRRVPTTVQVRPGALVHIVLKQDQPTGRTVQGVVQAVLTRGNHPRGIKVRLADGRVGRVQAMMDEAATGATVTVASATATSSAFSAGRVSTSAPAPTPAPAPAPAARVWKAGPSDVRDEAVPLEQIGLDAYIKPAKQKKRRGGGAGAAGTAAANAGQAAAPAPPPPQQQTCPVCNDFQGDADAVAHHVAGHFDA